MKASCKHGWRLIREATFLGSDDRVVPFHMRKTNEMKVEVNIIFGGGGLRGCWG